MAKVITFSRYFPSYHPRKGEPTYFVEKLLNSFLMAGSSIYDTDTPNEFLLSLSINHFEPKHHTIRAGHRFKVGDWFSPRVWSAKPYNSKQIIIAPDIQVKKVWDFETVFTDKHWWVKISGGNVYEIEGIKRIAENDGLVFEDFCEWFKLKNKVPFTGQIICWNENINY